MRSVAWVDGSSVVVGATARIEQPGLRPALWTVTQVEAGTSFTWQSVAPGITTVAVHEMMPAPGGSRLRLAIAQTGPLAGVVGLVFGKKAKRYVDMEAAGLKRRAEESSPS